MTFENYESVYLNCIQEGDVAVAKFRKSHLSEEENIEEMGHDLFNLVEQHNQNKVVLSLEAVEYITSAVLGKMISLHRKLHRVGGKLVVCCFSGSVAEVLQSSRLVNYFNVADTVPSAVSQFQS